MTGRRAGEPRPHVVLVAHGSRDPRSAATVRALARAVAAARPGVQVHDAYLDFDAPHLSNVLTDLRTADLRTADLVSADGGPAVAAPVVVVPLLLSAAYHARTDIPSVVATARAEGARIEVTNVLTGASGRPGSGDANLMVDALRRRVRATGDFDGMVLGAAGTSNVEALATIDTVADALGRTEGLPCIAGYASGAGRPIADAIDVVRRAGARRIGIAAYFLAPGRLYDRIRQYDQIDPSADHGAHDSRDASGSRVARAGRSAGRVVTAAPLGDAVEIVAIAAQRIDQGLNASQALV